MPQLYLNNFTTTFIASVKSAPATANPAAELDYGILRVSDGAAGTLINPPAGSWYVLTSYKRSGTVESDYEILRVTGVDNSVVGECRLTVLRGQEGTTPKAYVAGDLVELRLTAGGISQYAQTTDPRLSDPRTPTGAAGGVLSGTFPNPGFAQPMATVAQMEGRVEKVAGKGLSANDYTNADLAKLAGIAEQASKNAPDSQLRDRSTHTGVQAISTVTDLQATLDAKEPGIAAGTAAQYWRGDKTWRDFATDVRATVLTGLSTATNTAIAAADTLLGALGKLQAQISAHFGSGGGAHAAATTGAAGFLSAGDKAKLDGVGYGATANATDAQLRDRSTHTGVQAIGTVSGLQGALDARPVADFSAVPDAGGLDDTEWLPINKPGGTYRRTTFQRFLDWILARANTWTGMQTLRGAVFQAGYFEQVGGPFYASNLPTIYMDYGSIQEVILNVNWAPAFPPPSRGCQLTLLLTQDGYGGRSFTVPGICRPALGTIPTLSTAANKSTLFSFIGTGSRWLFIDGGRDYDLN